MLGAKSKFLATMIVLSLSTKRLVNRHTHGKMFCFPIGMVMIGLCNH